MSAGTTAEDFVWLGFVLTAMSLGWRRGARAGLVFTVFYGPQLAVLTWMLDGLRRWQVSAPGPVALASGVLLGGYTLLLFHRLTTYAFPLPPSRADLVWVIPVHIFQTALLSWVVLWPVSRLSAPALEVELLVMGGPLGLAAMLLLLTHRKPQVRHQTLELSGLTQELRVVQVSDLHVGPYMGSARLEALARDLNALRPDLLVFTGDFLTLRTELDYGPLLRFLELLETPTYGMFGCLGNHDMAVASSLVRDLSQAGLQILVDESRWIALEKGGVLRVTGLGWYARQKSQRYADAMGAALAVGTVGAGPVGAGPVGASSAPTLVLCHDPAAFDHLGDAWQGLMLAGHLHGGQLGLSAFGWDVSILRLFGLYDQGVFGGGARVLYVHRGTGVYGFPVRVGVAAEVVALQLVPPPGDGPWTSGVAGPAQAPQPPSG